jgi:Na+-transporting methylmalonyl-CoA/oxaloacetate decarboxylase gamma subunit
VSNVQQGLEIMVIGLAVVFAALYGLSLVMELMAKILGSKKEVESVEEIDSDANDEELVAVMSAVMAVVGVDKIGSMRIVNR